MNNTEQPVGKQWAWYSSASGIWQTVYLEPRSASYLKCWRVISDIDKGTAQFHVETVGAADGWEVAVEITAPDASQTTSVFKVSARMAHQ